MNSQLPPDKALTISEAMKIRRYQNISKALTRNDRIRLIKEKSRHKLSLVDVSLHIKNKFYSNQAMYWRMNSLMFGKKCSICKEKFYYTHTERCLGLKNTDELFSFDTIPQLIKRLRTIIKLVDPSFLLSSNIK